MPSLPVLTKLRQRAAGVATAGLLAALGSFFFPLVQDAHGAGGATPPGVYRFDRAAVIDPAGMERPMAAGTLFIPHGWRTTGGIVWGPQYACTDYLGVEWSATAPDDRAMIAWLPQGRWERNNTGNPQPLKIGCQQKPFTDAKGYLESLVRSRFPGARLLDYRRRPDLEAIKAPTTRPVQGGGQSTTRSDAGQMLFAFSARGEEMRGVVVASVDFDHTQLPVAGMGPLQFMTAVAWPAYLAVAPNGQLDFRLYDAIRASYQIDPAWMKRVTDHVNKIHAIELDGVRKRNEIWRNTSEQIGQIITSSWNAQQRSADQRAFEFGQLIRGVETYRDENGKGTELKAGYANAWKLDDGSYLLSTQSQFDPRRELGINGQKLEPQR
jgi:hypothetical protein